MTLRNLAPAYIQAIAPYQPGKPISELQRELGLTDIIKLASNENPLGTSPKALAAIRAGLAQLARYPDGSAYALKSALAEKLGVATEAIVIGNGSNEVLELVAQSFLVPGLEAIYCEHAFAVYPLAIQAAGATGIEVQALDFGTDPAAILAAVTANTRIVFIANPNNPTGTLLDAKALENLLADIPARILVVVDEAYNEYLPSHLRADTVAWMSRFPNLIITRTFSKIYGLAGLRVGYALCHPDVADMLNRVRQPFNVNSLAQDAALAALSDEAFLKESFATNQRGLAQLTLGFGELSLSMIPSVANFISFHVGDAAGVFQKLLKCGIIVRPIANYGLPEYLRVSVGVEQENQSFLRALKEVL